MKSFISGSQQTIGKDVRANGSVIGREVMADSSVTKLYIRQLGKRMAHVGIVDKNFVRDGTDSWVVVDPSKIQWNKSEKHSPKKFADELKLFDDSKYVR